MRVTFTQNHSESGAVDGEGIEWYWSRRDFVGNEDTVQEMGDAVIARLKKDWPEIKEDELHEVPFVAELDWDGKIEVVSLRLNFDFTADALFGPEETLEEVQDFFSTPLELQGEFKVGENTVKIGDKTITITVDAAPE